MAKTQVDNSFYNTLGERWLTAEDHPIALLRAEAKLRNAWVLERIKRTFQTARVLDVGCGAGLLSRSLAEQGHSVTGVDLAEKALEIARKTCAGDFLLADASNLPFADEAFDVVCTLDVLEHVEPVGPVIAEGARVLRSGGLWITYTFNRTPEAWLLAVKGMEWVVNNTPKHLHVWRLFLTPKELSRMATKHGMQFESFQGLRPEINSAFWRLIKTGVVPKDFSFRYTPSLRVGYLGCAKKS